VLSVSSTLHNAAETTRKHDSWLFLREVIGNFYWKCKIQCPQCI